MIHRLSLQERVALAKQGRITVKEEVIKLIEDLWREIERLRKHYQER